MSFPTLNIRTLGCIAREFEVPYTAAARIIDSNGITPAVVDNGVRKFDQAAVNRILEIHEAEVREANGR